MPTISDTMISKTSLPRSFLLLTVFITGASILIIELIGTRILAPFYGSGLYTWSALIAVTLAALAAGYAVGGKLVDKHPKSDLLFYLCLIAGLWTLLTPALATHTLPYLVALSDVRLNILLSSILLFSPNLFSLGMASPFVIRLLSDRYQAAGTTSGLVFSISTIGSLLAALGTGFFLMPNFGVLTIFIFCGLTLIILAVTGLAFLKRFAMSIATLALTSLFIAGFTPSSPTATSSFELIDSAPSFYGHVQVVRKDGFKTLLVDGIGQNYIMDKSQYTLTYINFLSALPLTQTPFNKPGKNSLIIGLGAGQLPMLLEKNGLNVESVEIDPIINIMARKHFGFNHEANKVHVTDGRNFLTQSTDTYDYIVIDAFNADQIAWHLLSDNAFLTAQSRLNKKGVLAINMVSLKNGDDVSSTNITLKSVFKYVRVFNEDAESELSNIIFIASDSPLEIDTQNPALSPSQKVNVSQYLAGEVKTLKGGTLLTDDYNPIAYQREHAQQHWRNEMRKFLGEKYYNWVYL